MFKLERSADGQIDTGNPLCLMLTCLQTHFSRGGTSAKQNRMLFLDCCASEEGGICVLALTLKITQKTFCHLYGILLMFSVFSDHAAPLGSCFPALSECERSPLTPCTNTRSKQAYQSGLLEQDKH